MQLTPYLCFNGQCAAAFQFYEQCFHGTLRGIQTYGESPMKDQEWVTPDWHDKVAHGTLVVGGRELMGSDVPPAHTLCRKASRCRSASRRTRKQNECSMPWRIKER